MVIVDVSKTINTLKAGFSELKEGPFNRAIANAINHTAGIAKTGANKEIRQIYNVKSSHISKAIRVTKANPNNLSGKVIAHGRPLSLTAFNGTRQTSKGASVAVIKGQRKTLKGGFIRTMRSGHNAVFVRGSYKSGQLERGKKRLPIQEIKSTSIPKALSNGIILNNLSKSINERFPKRATHELSRLINKK